VTETDNIYISFLHFYNSMPQFKKPVTWFFFTFIWVIHM